MTHYKLITDLDMLYNFIDKVLPNENDGEQFYLTLFCRKKYDKTGILKCDKNCLKRTTSKKKDIVQKIMQMEVPIGAYKYERVDVPIDTLAVYISPNPRSFHRASAAMAVHLVQQLANGRVTANPHSVALNLLQTSSENKVYFDVDIDFLDEADFIPFVNSLEKSVINLNCCTFIRTRGGYHCLVKVERIEERFKKTWYQSFANFKFKKVEIMMNSDGLVPIPGTKQGDFTPEFYG